ncbi:MAG: plasmid pRiA4b ORF-3 family protein [Planctomycetes bacterium]|nr:plasmid pRiA4b ORF-3 family protein [Planctomycetota bacterium]
MYQVCVTLKGSRAAVWRRLLVPADIALDRLHFVLQAAMGWSASHGHLFRVGGKEFGDAKTDIEEDPGGDCADEGLLTFEKATLSGMQEVEYEYDPGDSWQHAIRVEKVVAAGEASGKVPSCVAGAGACPPEDVGGVAGYENFLWVLSHPNHQDHERNLKWVGGAFDPDCFDLAAANRRVRAVTS